MDRQRITELLTAFDRYAAARRTFLARLGLDASNRDPLAEFSEASVQALLGGELPASRVQKDYDLVDPAGRRVQVKYLANPAGTGAWVNEHPVGFGDGTDAYALVLFEALAPRGVIVFARPTLAAVCARLGKRHPDQDRTLQFTRRNAEQILGSPAAFEALGVQVFAAPGWASVAIWSS